MSAFAHTTPALALKKLKAGIRAECAKQGVDDTARRLMMMRLAGVESSTRLDLNGAHRILAHLQGTGGRRQTGAKTGKPSVAKEWRFVFDAAESRKPLLSKIYRLAQTIGGFQSPPVAVMPKAWVEGVAKQSRGLNKPDSREKTIKPLELCDEGELCLIVQILAAWVSKHGKNPNPLPVR